MYTDPLIRDEHKTPCDQCGNTFVSDTMYLGRKSKRLKCADCVVEHAEASFICTPCGNEHETLEDLQSRWCTDRRRNVLVCSACLDKSAKVHQRSEAGRLKPLNRMAPIDASCGFRTSIGGYRRTEPPQQAAFDSDC